MANKLKLITDKAKKLYKTGKYKKWTDAIKQASKSIGAVKIIQKGESKNAKVTKTLMQKRNKKGQFKGYSVISGVTKTAKKKVAKKKVAKSYHKDTKSHNVRISVMSGVNQNEIDFWIRMFAPRTKKLQLEWYRNLVSSFKYNDFDIFTPREKGEAQLRALELILNKKPLKIK